DAPPRRRRQCSPGTSCRHVRPLGPGGRRLLPAEPRRRAERRDWIERHELAVVELEGHARLPAARAAERVARAVERVGERHFGIALRGHPQLGARFARIGADVAARSEEHTSELQSLAYLVCRLLLEKKKKK